MWPCLSMKWSILLLQWEVKQCEIDAYVLLYHFLAGSVSSSPPDLWNEFPILRISSTLCLSHFNVFTSVLASRLFFWPDFLIPCGLCWTWSSKTVNNEAVSVSTLSTLVAHRHNLILVFRFRLRFSLCWNGGRWYFIALAIKLGKWVASKEPLAIPSCVPTKKRDTSGSDLYRLVELLMRSECVFSLIILFCYMYSLPDFSVYLLGLILWSQ